MSEPVRRPERRLSPRRRRLRVAAAALAVAVVVAIGVGVAAYRSSRPESYRPGEAIEGITGNLARGLPEGAPEPRFEDVTAAAGLAGFRSFAGPRSSQLPEDMGAGAAWGDFDDDGDDDLFVVGAGGALNRPPEERAPSRLYENRGDGGFAPVDTFPDTRILGMGAAWGDFDGDGRLDLAVTGYRALRLYRNLGDGRFQPVEDFPEPEGFWAGVAWGDFDGDRDLDLYVCGYVRYLEDKSARGRSSRQFDALVPHTLNPASYEPERNLLFRNDGGGRFTEVAEQLGAANPQGRSLSALWHDFDDDGWLDLYVANDVSDNALLMNRGGSFEDESHAAWVADYRGAMGLAAGDWNRDGDDDLFVTHWIAQENALYDSLLADLAPASPDEDARQLTFADQSALAGLGQVSLHSVGWGTEFADFDCDGWLDLVVANGSTFETEQEPKQLKAQPPFLFWNRGDFFHDLAPLAPALAQPHVGRGLAVSDYDRDGDLDLLFVHHDAGVQLLRNDMQRGNWIELRLRSRPGTPGGAAGFGDGARVVARVGDVTLRRTVSSASYLSQSTRTVHLGLGAAGQVDSVEVRWLGGETDSWRGLAGGTVWELREGDPEPRRAAERTPAGERERVARFWETQRAGMDAMKRDGDCRAAAELFRSALALDPDHEDARYYLGHCLAELGSGDQALAEFAALQRTNPGSHRAWKQWGTLRAVTATNDEQLAAAEAALDRARKINPEETGTLLVLGELALLRGEAPVAAERFEWVCRTNPRAVSGFFLRAYLAWKDGDAEAAGALLARAREARGEDWKPEGTTAEGDAEHAASGGASPLARFWRSWDGGDPPEAFAALDRHLQR